ncbi:hypothetical protein B5X24_HaOG214571 [Helicoverpa armigera]|nr:hypothetical protein B5X24_HaOG214571 [Helicoverpa armigera]
MTNSSKSSLCSLKKESVQDRLLTFAIKNLIKRIIICIRTLCCFPLDKIVPRDHTKNIIPRQRVSDSNASKARSLGSSNKAVKNKKSRHSLFRGKSLKKNFAEPSIIMSQPETKIDSESTVPTVDTSIKTEAKSRENRWKSIMRKTPCKCNKRWMKQYDLKPRENFTSSCTDNEDSAGDGPLPPALAKKKTRPLRWNLVQEQSFDNPYVEYLKKDVVRRVCLET